MTPGERRRRDRKYAREEGWKEFGRKFRGTHMTQKLRGMPHPKMLTGTAYDYVSWCIDQGYSAAAFKYLESL